MNTQLLVTITITALNFLSLQTEAAPWPTGNNDTLEVKKNETVTIDVLANDIGSGLKVLSVDSWTDNGGKAIINNSQKTIIYTAPDIIGDDSFWYDLIDNESQSNYASVNIKVIDSITKPQSDNWPVAIADSISTTKNESIKINILDNDIGNGLTISELDNWTDMGGRVKLDIAKKIITYTPATEFKGVDKFWYGLVDNQKRDNYSEVTITVSAPPNDEKLSANLDIASITKNETINISVLNNDTGKALKIKSVNSSSNKGGTTHLNSSKTTITYKPLTDFIGIDTFQYEIIDASNNTDTTEVKVIIKNDGVNRFTHVPMHYDLLENQEMIWGEIGSEPPYSSIIYSITLTQPSTQPLCTKSA